MALKGNKRDRWALTWAAVVFSALAMLAITFLHGLQHEASERSYAVLSTLRLARIDLVEGLLRVMPSGAGSSDRAEGLALVRQASETFEEGERTLRAAFPEAGTADETRAIRKAFDELFARLGSTLPAKSAATGYYAGLRIAFNEIERRMEERCARLEDELHARLRRLDVGYIAALWLSSLVLVAICIAIFIGARAEAAADEALAEHRELFRHIIDNAPSLIYSFDAEGRCVLANRKLAALFGKEPEALIGEERKQWMPEEIGNMHRANDQLVFQSGHEISLEETLPRDEGEQFFLTTKFPLVDINGKIYAVGGISTDITHLKQIEGRLRTALTEREVLLRELNHRTKNNMQVISSWLMLQSRRSRSPEAQDVLREAEARVQAMALVHRKLYQGGDLSYIDLAAYIRDLVTLLSSAYGAPSARISTELELQDIRAVIDVALPCGLIVNELFSNALKHAFPENRQGTIRFSLRRETSGEIELRYSDDGVGCPDPSALAESGGLGLKTIEAIGTGQLGGRTSFMTEGGFGFSLLFSDAEYGPRV